MFHRLIAHWIKTYILLTLPKGQSTFLQHISPFAGGIPVFAVPLFSAVLLVLPTAFKKEERNGAEGEGNENGGQECVFLSAQREGEKENGEMQVQKWRQGADIPYRSAA